VGQGSAVVELPGARQAKDVIPAPLLDRLERGFGGKGGVGLDNHLLAGGPHPPEQPEPLLGESVQDRHRCRG
jgi:hypothetical protein